MKKFIHQDPPWTIHHREGAKVSAGEAKQNSANPISPVAEHEVGQKNAVVAERLVVAQDEEWDEKEAENDSDP